MCLSVILRLLRVLKSVCLASQSGRRQPINHSTQHCCWNVCLAAHSSCNGGVPQTSHYISSFLPSFLSFFLNFCLSFFFPVFSFSLTFLRLSFNIFLLIFLLLLSYPSLFVSFHIDSIFFLYFLSVSTLVSFWVNLFCLHMYV